MGTISPTGLYTAPPNSLYSALGDTSADTARSVTVIATSTADPNKSASVAVSIQSGSSSGGFLVWNTGMSASGAVADGTPDPNYRIISSPGGRTAQQNAVVVHSDRFPIGVWMENSGKSKWIAPVASLSAGVPGGTYIYRLTFDLTGYDLSSVRISGLVAADDNVGLVLNGRMQFSSAGTYHSFTPFHLEDGFVPAVNTLDFVVNNQGNWDSPSGLRVELTGTARRQ